MKICGIIAEYNPFHNGHNYHIEEAKRLTGADYCVIVMSGNFVQRGSPAILDKYARAEMVLNCGADLVLELPSFYSTGSAEYFAKGAVNLLHKLGCVTHLCFGSECGDIEILTKIADILANEPPEFQAMLRHNLKLGKSYPIARSQALLHLYPELTQSLDVLSSPNNILGIEYIKSLLQIGSDIVPVTTARKGSGYHEHRFTTSTVHASATAIRVALGEGRPISAMEEQIPPVAFEIFRDKLSQIPPMWKDDLSSQLRYKLLSERNKGYEEYMDVSPDLSDRIKKKLPEFTTFTKFSDLLKTKEITYTRVCRSLLHILLNMKKQDMSFYKDALDLVPYARILGFRKDSKELLTQMNKTTSIPMITKLADASSILSEDAYNMLIRDIEINSIYYGVIADKIGQPIKNEYTTQIVIV
ncbi:MAG: nucleotidyltransferase [Lachnospiraceae bacterium]|nr:nucleotidyltransferase [Lachnospiraceae bacterium]